MNRAAASFATPADPKAGRKRQPSPGGVQPPREQPAPFTPKIARGIPSRSPRQEDHTTVAVASLAAKETSAWPNCWPTLSAPLLAPSLRVLSLGAGVQSTTLLLAAADGKVGPMPDVAIFADTEDEPQEVYDHLGRLVAMRLPIPIEIVSAGSIRKQMLGWAAGETEHANGRPPLFVEDARGKVGMTRRQCTQDWKIVPIERRIRELLGLKKGARGPKEPVVEQWIGISTDESHRMKPAYTRWIYKRYPLIEADKNRRDCVAYCSERGVMPPKSACRMCPFHTDAEWQRLKVDAPADFEAACEVDDSLREGRTTLRGTPYLHRSCQPLRAVDFTASLPEPLAWLGECEGMCGV